MRTAADGSQVDEDSGELVAPAPSRVLGADVDGDGKLDAIVSHAEGAGVILTSKRSIEMPCW